MKEGYWANYDSGDVFLIHEHEMWIRADGNAEKLGVPSPLFADAAVKYKPQRDRKKYFAPTKKRL